MGFDNTGFILEEPKPPPFILWIIAVSSCLLFVGAAVMIAIGAVYAYGTLGMTLVGCGAVLYFATVVALVLSCIKVQKRYPGRRLLPSRLMPGRNIRRLSILANPHTSGCAPEKASNGHQHQEPPSAPNPQEESSPAEPNSGESTATEATCKETVDPRDKEYAVDEQQKLSQKESTCSDPHSGELAALTTISDIINDKFHLHHQQASPTPQSDSQQKGQDPASIVSISSLEDSILDRRQGWQHLQEPVPSLQCVADVSSMLPSIVEVPESKENQHQQLDIVHSSPKSSTDIKEQQDGLSPCDKTTGLRQLDGGPQHMEGAVLDSNSSDVAADPTLSCDHVTESHCKFDVPSPDVSPVTSFSVEENSISYSLVPSNAKPELLHELQQHHKDVVDPVPHLQEVNTSPAESPPQILKSALSHKQHPYIEDSTAQCSAALTTTLNNSPPTERNFIYHQSQHHIPEETPPTSQCSVRFVIATPPTPTSSSKQIALDAVDIHQPDGPTIASGGMARILNSSPRHEAHVSHLKLQPKYCDNTMPSVLNYQHMDNAMPPPLPPKRRHSSFHTETQQLEFVRPTGMFFDKSGSSTLPAFPPSRRKYLSDHEQDQHHQEVRVSTPRPKEPTREPDTSAPSYRKLRTHRSRGRDCKDLPPVPAPRSTEFEAAPTLHDVSSQIMALPPRHYRHNHHDTSPVNPRYSNYVPSRTVALPRSASTLVLHTGQHPGHLGTVRHNLPSGHFGSSVAAPRPGHMRNLSYHRQYHEY